MHFSQNMTFLNKMLIIITGLAYFPYFLADFDVFGMNLGVFEDEELVFDEKNGFRGHPMAIFSVFAEKMH